LIRSLNNSQNLKKFGADFFDFDQTGWERCGLSMRGSEEEKLGFGVWGLGFGVWGLGFGVWGLGFGVWGLGFWGYFSW
jgi:hypothetical protein